MKNALCLGLILFAVCACDDPALPPITPVSDMGRFDGTPDLFTGIDMEADQALDARMLSGTGDPCDGPEACRSGWCVPDGDGNRVCTDLCGDDSDCPDSWECRPVANAGDDAVFICIAPTGQACEVCEDSDDCGFGNDICVTIGLSERCARQCSANDPCPEDATCVVWEATGQSYCEPNSGTCDPCLDPDGDGYGNEGECLGQDCNEEDMRFHDGAPELCDGLDNDCDSTPDEDVGAPPADVSCLQAGACAETVPECVNGGWVCNYPLGYEETEVSCDTIDNDCDERIDETIVASCGSDVGACALGTQTCTDGEFGTCLDEITPTDETCDALDNDCDGATDEQVTRACGSDVGVCEEGIELCTDGVFGECLDSVDPVDETCDGLDNNCDGENDEGNPGSGGACDTGVPGVCAPGTENCRDGALQCDQNLMASPDNCDGLDNDCDGSADEANPGGGGACNTMVPGMCAPGVVNCVAGALSCVQTQQPINEACDGLDNDCDGSSDELNPDGGGACDTGRPGVCSAGTDLCANSAIVCDQNVQPHLEVCDNLDNDCDGNSDEGDPGGGGNCDTGLPGICAPGREHCREGAIVCEQNLNAIEEVCDGFDNDCDGNVDEGFDDLEDLPDDEFADTNCDGIDGDMAEAVFVSPGGDDAAAGTAAAPLRTIQRAILIAQADEKYVIASSGTFSGRINLISGVHIYGGYQNDNGWSRSHDAQTIIDGDTVGLVAFQLNETTIVDGLSVRAQGNVQRGGSSYAIWIRDSGSHLVMTNMEARAGDGGSGSDGQNGSLGSAGGNGAVGSNGCDSDNLGVGGCARQGGSGGASVCGAGTGGRGGNGGDEGNGSRGSAGIGLDAGSGGTGGVRGRKSVGCGFLGLSCCGTQAATVGGNGSNGSAPADRNSPRGGLSFGSVDDDTQVYTPADGQAGPGGLNGYGGGGGGGGGGATCSVTCCLDDIGGSGGGGGAGGCGGRGGLGGAGGGGSFGIWIINSAPQLQFISIQTADGGRGGAGGVDGSGGPGGVGGAGGNGHDIGERGGRGGRGSTGGNAGHGSGGGGGPSVGIVSINSDLDDVAVGEFTLGAGGIGGISAGQLGDAGLRTDTHIVP